MLAAALSLPVVASAGVFEDEQATVDRVRQLEVEVAAHRHLDFTHPVDVEIEDPEQMRASMQERIDEELTSEDVEAWKAYLGAFRLADPGYDPLAATMALLEQGVGGYYDPVTKRLVLVARGYGGKIGPIDSEDMIASHELVHALQDQNFGLTELTERVFENDDAMLAIASLVEGDASQVMYRRTLVAMGLDPDIAGVGMLVKMEKAGTEMMMGASYPRAIGAPLMFRYHEGTLFAESLRRDGGWAAIDAAYRKVPLSTEQILHPDRYLAGDWPVAIDLPDLAALLGPGWSSIAENTNGEFGTSLVLDRHLPMDPTAVAQGWDGDRYMILARGDERCLVWLTTWDTVEDAEEFAKAAKELGPKLGKARVERSAKDVLLLVGVPRRASRAVVDAVGGAPRAELTDIAVFPPRP